MSAFCDPNTCSGWPPVWRIRPVIGRLSDRAQDGPPELRERAARRYNRARGTRFGEGSAPAPGVGRVRVRVRVRKAVIYGSPSR
jgi:hypothetical protein